MNWFAIFIAYLLGLGTFVVLGAFKIAWDEAVEKAAQKQRRIEADAAWESKKKSHESRNASH